MRPLYHRDRASRSSRGRWVLIAAVQVVAVLAAVFWAGQLLAMQPLAENDLRDAVGRDGVRFDVSGFQVSGDLRLTYFAPGNAGSIYWGNLEARRTDDTAAGFSDPYKFDIVGRPGASDVMVFANPANAQGLAAWRVAFDWGVDANGLSFDGGAMLFRDLVWQGGGMQWTTPPAGTDGIAWGWALRASLADWLWQPRGRNAASWSDPAAEPEQLRFSGIRIGAAAADGSAPTQPWQIAEVTRQPGILNVITDEAGQPRVHWGIGWPTTSDPVPTGTLQIDKIVFQSGSTGTLDLGSSRIGGIQLQYLDVRLKP